jgi:hypothetical protein
MDHISDKDHPKKPARKGLINPYLVNVSALIVITIGILVAVTASIMAIWEYTDKDTLLRTIATVLVIIVGVGVFAKINQALGE